MEVQLMDTVPVAGSVSEEEPSSSCAQGCVTSYLHDVKVDLKLITILTEAATLFQAASARGVHC